MCLHQIVVKYDSGKRIEVYKGDFVWSGGDSECLTMNEFDSLDSTQCWESLMSLWSLLWN